LFQLVNQSDGRRRSFASFMDTHTIFVTTWPPSAAFTWPDFRTGSTASRSSCRHER